MLLTATGSPLDTAAIIVYMYKWANFIIITCSTLTAFLTLFSPIMHSPGISTNYKHSICARIQAREIETERGTGTFTGTRRGPERRPERGKVKGIGKERGRAASLKF